MKSNHLGVNTYSCKQVSCIFFLIFILINDGKSQENLYTITIDKSKLTQEQASILQNHVAKITADSGIRFTATPDQITNINDRLVVGKNNQKFTFLTTPDTRYLIDTLYSIDGKYERLSLPITFQFNSNKIFKENNSQVIDFSRKIFKILDYETSIIGNFSEMSKNDDLSRAKNFMFGNYGTIAAKSRDEIEAIRNSFPADILNELIKSNAIQVNYPIDCDINEDTFSQLYESAGESSEMNGQFENNEKLFTSQISKLSLPLRLDTIPLTYFKKIFLLDVFDEHFSCAKDSILAHGSMVIDVIRETLDSLHLDADNILKDKLKKIPVNYYNHSPWADSFLLNHLNKTRKSGEPQDTVNFNLEKGKLDFLSKAAKDIQSNTKKSKLIPDVYIKYLYESIILDSLADIVSTSFVFNNRSNSVLPYVLREGKNRNINYFSAVLNISNSDINTLISPALSSTTRQEPLVSYVYDYPEIPVVLVGATNSQDEIKSQLAREQNLTDGGRRVSMFGQYNGWGGSKTCIKPKIGGTSFSTPYLVSLLFVAKALWRSQGNNSINAQSVRHRFLQSINFSNSYFNKVGSPGKLNLLKLFSYFKGFAETKTGEIIKVSDIKGTLYDKDDVQIKFGRNNTNDYRIGIIFNGPSTLVYNPKLACWQEIFIGKNDVRNETESTFRILLMDGWKNYSLSQLRETFRHITITN